MIHLATGLAIQNGRILLVASRYSNHEQPLWNLPGGRQLPGELLSATAAREFLEETGLHVEVKELAYISESYDGAQHFLNATFKVTLRSPFETVADKGDNDHIVGAEWVPIDDVERRIAVAVVREPLLAYLRGELGQRYAGYQDAGVTIEWPDHSQ
jgi:ADP-ribose pyrophosphatase YjhB (NUDIX family)